MIRPLDAPAMPPPGLGVTCVDEEGGAEGELGTFNQGSEGEGLRSWDVGD